MTATGLHPTMNVRHEPAERVLLNEKRHNQPVKYFRGGAIVYLFGPAATAGNSFGSLWRCSKTSAAASSSI
jgi:hypothetical protein